MPATALLPVAGTHKTLQQGGFCSIGGRLRDVYKEVSLLLRYGNFGKRGRGHWRKQNTQGKMPADYRVGLYLQ
jgi:hypothetical protein